MGVFLLTLIQDHKSDLLFVSSCYEIDLLMSISGNNSAFHVFEVLQSFKSVSIHENESSSSETE